MHFATLTLEVAHEIMPTTDFHQKFEKNKILHVFSKSYNIPLMEFFRFHKESGIYCANLVLRCAKPHTWAWLAQKIGWHSNFILPLAPLTFVLGAKMVVGFHPCNMPHKCAKFGPRGYFSF